MWSVIKKSNIRVNKKNGNKKSKGVRARVRYYVYCLIYPGSLSYSGVDQRKLNDETKRLVPLKENEKNLILNGHILIIFHPVFFISC